VLKQKTFFYIGEGEWDAHLFHEGTYYKSYEFLGAHFLDESDDPIVRFVLWSPHAREIHLVGDFNKWHDSSLPMKKIGRTDFWEICVRDISIFDAYKYRITTFDNAILYKSDPYAFHAETHPQTASKIYDLSNYTWHDTPWLTQRKRTDHYHSPLNIYEVNLRSWKQKPDGTSYSYIELAALLIPYVKKMNYTHIELMPIMEHPFDGSWGYQLTGYFAPTSRYGSPKDFMYFIDQCHQNGIGVLLDWVPSHYCKDEHGLAYFDGAPTFESSDPSFAENVLWGTMNFDYSKPEVHSFLISNALYWHEYYHIDGLRIDAVAYMLYSNFKLTQNGEPIFSDTAVEFIKKLNTVTFKYFPNTLMIAEESSAYPKVTHPVHEGGLGFNYKWNMGWMNDTLKYFELDPVMRKGSHHALTFSIMYAFTENFVLPLSHDEVVHGKKSLLDKMPGDYESKFANLKVLYAYMIAHPGKKILFMGSEFGQFIEWNEWQSLDWHLLEYPAHQLLSDYVSALNHLYLTEPCFYEKDTSFEGFEWIEVDNANESVISFERKDNVGNRVIVILNFTPVERVHYPVGISVPGTYIEIMTTHPSSSHTKPKTYTSIEKLMHHRYHAIYLTLPSYGGIYLKLKEENNHERR